jgi:predicted transcriptional regulator
MTKDVTITARIDEDLSARLTKLASAQGRSKSWLVGRALESYLETELAFAAAVEDGRRDARAGRTSKHESVVRRFKARFAARK